MILDWDDHGFALGGDMRRRIPWAEVEHVYAFKRDVYIVDSLRIALQAAGRTIEVSEEWEQWEDFVQAIPRHLPGCLSIEQWFFVVAFPAFETNFTEIYLRDPPA